MVTYAHVNLKPKLKNRHLFGSQIVIQDRLISNSACEPPTGSVVLTPLESRLPRWFPQSHSLVLGNQVRAVGLGVPASDGPLQEAIHNVVANF